MPTGEFFLYLAVMALTTYVIRAVPFAAVTGKIENRFVKSFLHYIPYAVLTAMTIPSIFYATQSPVSAIAGLVVAVVLALFNKGLTLVAGAACLTVFLVELIPGLPVV